ncbi:MAG: hypothetical protein U9M95_00275 [Candidatus Altiarchaeota archaeon]|nr:hypothetical protein [Candidatus Altiarchaeota archaeon]
MRVNMEYTHLEASRFTKPSGKVNIHNNSNISEISRSGEVIIISFTFTSTYNPSVGEIKIDGNIMLSDVDENVEQDFREWEGGDGETIPSELARKVHNTIISNCIVEATLLSREILLPPPTPAPRVKAPDGTGVEKDSGDKRYKDTQDYIR